MRTGNSQNDMPNQNPLRVARGALPLLLLAALAAGCGMGGKVSVDSRFVSELRANKGMVIILPGIEGESLANHNIRQGLADGGIPYALAIYRWGFPVPGIGMMVNQTNADANRKAGRELAQAIVKYQRLRPGRPVFLIGHSGGGGIAIFALETLAGIPGAQPIEGAFLLHASISASHPLGRALRMTRRGIANAYNPEDTAMLSTGTGMFGNVDGGHGPTAGLHGFTGRYPKLYQKQITASSAGVLSSPHYVLTQARLIRERAPDWIMNANWPPPRYRGR